MARVQLPERLANAAVIRTHRPQIWIDASGSPLVVEISRTVELDDRRDLTSYVEVQFGDSEWVVKPHLGRLDEGEDTVWRGREVIGRDSASLPDDLKASANESMNAMLTFDPQVTSTDAD